MFDHCRSVYLCGMRIAIGSDHAGFRLKEQLVEHLRAAGNIVDDKGTMSEESTDYPDHAHVEGRKGDLGIVICGSGNGVNITANKHVGVRSALAWTVEVAKLARQHNDANILALPARFLSLEEAIAITDAFLSTKFEGGRHQRRVSAIEG